MIDAITLRALIDYEPETGVFVWRPRDREYFSRDGQWRNWNGRYPGIVAGRVGPKGYRAIAVLDRLYPAHRLAWLYAYGHLPTRQIDHINGDRDDNRIANLRDVTAAENAKNRRLQVGTRTARTGVTEYAFQGSLKYVARIRHQGRLHHLGYFKTIEAAAAARAEAEERLGFHANHGSPSRSFEKRRPTP